MLTPLLSYLVCFENSTLYFPTWFKWPHPRFYFITFSFQLFLPFRLLYNVLLCRNHYAPDYPVFQTAGEDCPEGIITKRYRIIHWNDKFDVHISMEVYMVIFQHSAAVCTKFNQHIWFVKLYLDNMQYHSNWDEMKQIAVYIQLHLQPEQRKGCQYRMIVD